MVKKIKITGEDFSLPNFFEDLSDPYKEISRSITGDSLYTDISYGDLNWAQKVLIHGQENKNSGFSYSAGLLANSLEEPLELILDERKPISFGYPLKDDKTIIVRGDLGKNTGDSMRGGRIFIDGNVDEISDFDGIIYVSGDVKQIKQIYNGILIVGGKINSVDERPYHMNCNSPINPSPFIFASNEVELIGHRGKYDKLPKRKSNILSKYVENSFDFNAENFIEKSLFLCRTKLREDLEKKINSLSTLNSRDEFVKFNLNHVDGFTTGFKEGYNEGRF